MIQKTSKYFVMPYSKYTNQVYTAISTTTQLPQNMTLTTINTRSDHYEILESEKSRSPDGVAGDLHSPREEYTAGH